MGRGAGRNGLQPTEGPGVRPGSGGGKEGGTVNGVDGVTVFSEKQGAKGQLQPHVLSINPFDIDAPGEALYEGLVMAVAERRRRHEALRDVVRTNDIARWITRQVQDIRDLAANPGQRAGAELRAG